MSIKHSKIEVLGFAIVMIFYVFLINEIHAEEIETIVVTGSTEHTVTSDPVTDVTLIESLMPATTVAGGFGGFAGYSERGTQPIHTTVFRNGVPANDAGAGWYDFGHDLATGNETVKIVHGPNSVLYGSGSLAGTVFINDNIQPGSTVRVGSDHQFVSHSLDNLLNVTYLSATNDSVRTDNDEEDDYKNLTARAHVDFGSYAADLMINNYEYDYDQCWDNWGLYTNTCMQEGQRGAVSVRGEEWTVGHTWNDADYFADSDTIWVSEANRWYADYRKNLVLTMGDELLGEAIIGATAEQEEYDSDTQDNYAIYGVLKTLFGLEVGSRVTQDAFVYRVGYENNGLFVNLGTSFRNPNLYQLRGDAWTNPNPGLDPEESIGYELGWNKMSYFHYRFSEGIDYDFNENQYVNIGKYNTQGFRFMDTFILGPSAWIDTHIGWTDTEQPRVAKYMFVVSGTYIMGGYTTKLTYQGMFDRKQSPYDTEELDNVNSFDFSIQKPVGNKYLISATFRDILDKEIDIIPGYRAGGRQIFLTLQYRPE